MASSRQSDELERFAIAFSPTFQRIMTESLKSKRLSQEEFWRRAEQMYGPYPKKK